MFSKIDEYFEEYNEKTVVERELSILPPVFGAGICGIVALVDGIQGDLGAWSIVVHTAGAIFGGTIGGLVVGKILAATPGIKREKEYQEKLKKRAEITHAWEVREKYFYSAGEFDRRVAEVMNELREQDIILAEVRGKKYRPPVGGYYGLAVRVLERRLEKDATNRSREREEEYGCGCGRCR